MNVWGHAGAPGRDFIYLFHMPVFFIVAGYCFNEKYVEKENRKTYLLRRIKALWVPYVTYVGGFTIIHNALYRINVYSDTPDFIESGASFEIIGKYSISAMMKRLLKVFFFGSSEQMAGASWFFKVMFEGMILFWFLQILLSGLKSKKIENVLSFAVCLLLSLSGFWLQSNCMELELFFHVTLSIMILIEIGKVVRDFSVLEKMCEDDTKKFRITKRIGIVLGGAIIILIVLYQAGAIELAANQYPNLLFLVLSSLAGFFLLFGIAKLIENTVLGCFFIYLGKHTVPIVFLHFLAFKVITFIQVRLYQDTPEYMLASFPVWHTEGIWCWLYIIAGIAIPLGIEQCCKNIFKFGKNKCQ